MRRGRRYTCPLSPLSGVSGLRFWDPWPGNRSSGNEWTCGQFFGRDVPIGSRILGPRGLGPPAILAMVNTPSAAEGYLQVESATSRRFCCAGPHRCSPPRCGTAVTPGGTSYSWTTSHGICIRASSPGQNQVSRVPNLPMRFSVGPSDAEKIQGN